MPRILAPNHSFHRRSSYGSRTSLTSEPPIRRSSLTVGYQNPAYQSAFSLRRSDGASGGKKSHSKHVQEQSKQNAVWEQGPSPSPTSLYSIQTKSTATTSQSSSISTLPSTNTSSTGLAAALSLMMQRRGSGGGAGATNNGRQVHPKAQSVPCSPNPPTDLASSFDLNCKINEEPDCWGQFVDVQSADEAMDRRSRVLRRYPGAPLSFPRY